MEMRGRTWCRTDPTFKVNDKPLQLSILAAVRELKADHTFITFKTNATVNVDLSHGQAKRELFGAPFTMTVQENIEQAADSIVVMVVVPEGGTGAELVITAHDQSGTFDNLIGVGYTDERVLLEPFGD